MSAKLSKVLWLLLCVLVLLPGPGAAAQSPAPSPSPAATATSAPPIPSPTHSPVAVLIVTPAATATPFSPLPSEVRAALDFIFAAGWRLVPFLLVAIVVLLARRVGGELLDTWAKGIAAALEDWRVNQAARFLPGPSPHERALLDDIFDRYEILELKALRGTEVKPAPLESVYVPLFTYREEKEAQRMLHRAASDELSLELPRERASELIELAKLLPLHRCLVITAGVGSGKTTFLHYVALTLARALIDRNPALLHQRLHWETARVPLPILLPLGDFGSYLHNLEEVQKEKGTPEVLKACPELLVAYMRDYFKDMGLPERFFAEQLEREAGALVLLDGLDEVGVFEDRVFISETISLAAQRYEMARFIVTCRPESYEGNARLASSFYGALLAPLRWPEDIELFIVRWRQERFSETAAAAQRYAQSFLQRVADRSRIRVMAENPLLLTVMLIVDHNVGYLPQRRAELYDKATEILLDWDIAWDRADVPAPAWLPKEAKAKRVCLEKLAYHWQQEPTLTMSCTRTTTFLAQDPPFYVGEGRENAYIAQERAAEFLRWVVDRTYLLRLRLADEMLSFYRRAFQEYLAARRLAQEPDFVNIVCAAWGQDEDWWQECLLLLVDHLSVADYEKARQLLEALLKVGDAAQRYLVLASRALADAERGFLPEVTVQVQQRLMAAIAVDNPAFAVADRVHAGDALAALGDARPGVCDMFPLVVKVPGGKFTMGEGDEQDEIDVPTFYIARYPVTNAQFAPFVDSAEGGYNNPEFWTAAGWAWRQGEGEGWGRAPAQRAAPMYWTDSRFKRPNQPVVGITWYEAVAYTRWLTHKWRAAPGELHIWRKGAAAPLDVSGWKTVQFRLPTEAEWEKAARGTDRRTWSWSNEFDITKANTGEGDVNRTTAVGLYPGGASPYDALDMIGNVWEWTSTQFADLPYRVDDGREDLVGTSRRVVRGGSWIVNRSHARCAYRLGPSPDHWDNYSGLRLALSPVFSDF